MLPVGQRKEVIREAHDEWGHQGTARTTALVKRSFAWPGLHEDIKGYVAKCKTCAVSKEEGVSSKTRLGTLEALEPSRDGKEIVLIVTDVFSKFSLAFLISPNISSTKDFGGGDIQ